MNLQIDRYKVAGFDGMLFEHIGQKQDHKKRRLSVQSFRKKQGIEEKMGWW